MRTIGVFGACAVVCACTVCGACIVVYMLIRIFTIQVGSSVIADLVTANTGSTKPNFKLSDGDIFVSNDSVRIINIFTVINLKI